MANVFNSFSIRSILGHIILVLLALGAFYYLQHHHFFPGVVSYLLLGLKIFIAFIIILGSSRSLMMPLFVCLLGLFLIFARSEYGIDILLDADAWQLLIMSGVGFVISVLFKW